MSRRELYLAFLAVVGVGVILGYHHHLVAGRAFFTMKTDRPVMPLVIIVSGPFSTLPALLLTLVRRTWGAIWLIAGGLLSLGAMVLEEIAIEQPKSEALYGVLYYSTTIVVPMVVLGLVILSLHRRIEHERTRTP